MKVFTTKGLIEIGELEVRDEVELGDNHRKVITQYRLGGELVRQSVFVDMLRPVDTQSSQGRLNGS